MTASTTTVAPSGVAAVLDRAVAAVAAQESAAVDLLVAAADWADAHVVVDAFEAAGWEDKKLYSERRLLVGGSGCPDDRRVRTPRVRRPAVVECGGSEGTDR